MGCDGGSPTSIGAHTAVHRVHGPRRLVVGLAVGLVVAAGIGVGVDRAFLSGQARHPWPPEACVVDGIAARCGTYAVPENRTEPNGRTIGLNVVVLPAFSKPARPDAVTYLEGGPGGAATDGVADRSAQLTLLNTSHDILLVDQRGTGRSKRHDPDVTQYGTRMAMDDLDAVRAALGYRELDVIGSSYGATAAQVYLRLHPASTHAVVLAAGTAIDVPFFGRYAVNAQRALDQLAAACDSQPDCHKAFPGWKRRLGRLVAAWNAHPTHGMSGDDLASVVHVMLLDGEKAVSIPLVVSHAAAGDYAALDRAGSGDLGPSLGLMSSIWCNEPWVGLDATGPWGTEFDSFATAQIAAFRRHCESVAKRAEPASLWRLPVRSSVPVIAFVGGADPQDPVANLSDLKRHFPDSRVVVFPRVGHQFNIGGCVDEMMVDVVDRGTTRGVDTTRCDGAVVVPPFPLTD
jgi:pimeloyl-ACP methyl ester carboxylesterase